MARPLRIEFPGALYHVTSRGNDRAAIYVDDPDRRLFLAVLADVIRRYNWRCDAYCLMTNHYHLLRDTPDANLSLGMRQLNGVFTQRSNRRHARVGHLFQGRFHSIMRPAGHASFRPSGIDSREGVSRSAWPRTRQSWSSAKRTCSSSRGTSS